VSNLDQTLGQFTSESMLFNANLDSYSESIKKVEETLKKININIEFYFRFKDVNDRKRGLYWARYGLEKHFRLLHELIDSSNPPLPLIEQKLEVRIDMCAHLVDFVNAFKEYIKKIRTNLEASGI